MAQVEAGVTELTADGRPVAVLGGDHTIALPALRALHAQHGPVALVHFDAHLDTWDTYFGAPCTHGTPFRRACGGGPAGHRTAPRTSASAGRSTTGDDLLEDAELGFTDRALPATSTASGSTG